MPLRNTPIQRKLMVIILMTTVATLLMMRLTFFTYEFFAFRKATLRQLSAVGHVIAANSTAALAFENREDAREILAALEADPHVIAAALYDNQGDLFATYPPGISETVFPARPGKAGYHFDYLTLTGFEPVLQGDRSKGTLYLKLETGEVMRQWFQDSVTITLVVILVSFVLAYLISKKLQKQISGPILTLTETARAISERP